MPHENPYAPPGYEQPPAEAEVIDADPIQPPTYVSKAMFGITLTVAMVLGGDKVIRDPAGRLALLGAALAGLSYSASLCDKKEPSVV